jgi:hypothetical protein
MGRPRSGGSRGSRENKLCLYARIHAHDGGMPRLVDRATRDQPADEPDAAHALPCGAGRACWSVKNLGISRRTRPPCMSPHIHAITRAPPHLTSPRLMPPIPQIFSALAISSSFPGLIPLTPADPSPPSLANEKRVGTKCMHRCAHTMMVHPCLRAWHLHPGGNRAMVASFLRSAAHKHTNTQTHKHTNIQKKARATKP